MWRPEQAPVGSGSPSCPDLLRHVGGPLSPVYFSFFEEECRAIATRLRAAGAAEPWPGPGEGSVLGPDAAGPVTSTPLRASPPASPPASPHLDEGVPKGATPAVRPSTDGCEAAAAASPGPARAEPRRLPQPAAGGCPSSRLSRPQAQSCKAARRGAGQPSCGGPGSIGRPRTPARSVGSGSSRLPISRTRASLGLELPKAGKGLGAPGTRLPQPPGTKTMLAAKSRLKHPSRASQLTQPPALPKPTPQDTETAVVAGSRRRPSQRLSTAIPAVASRSRLRLLGNVASPKRFCLGSTTQEQICNRTQELMETSESKEQLVAAEAVLGEGRTDETWVCAESSSSRELSLDQTPGCGDAVRAEQSAGDQLSQELQCVKNELERVKGELADKTAQCEAYCRMISSLRAQLRAAGICPEDAAMEESGDSGRD
ncbi:uncharacterized protein O9250_006644 [Rhynochetos jubatus]